MPSFEVKTSAHRITVSTRDDYCDGRVRIEPPVHAESEYWNEYIGDDPAIFFNYGVIGKTATLMGFQMKDNFSVVSIGSTYEDRIRYAVSQLAEDLVQIEDVNKFKEF